jgi:hypothetical protein
MGCSSGNPTEDITVKWDNGVIKIDGKETQLESYSGYEAAGTANSGLYFELSLDTATDVTNITSNTQGIMEENMDKYKGCYYYTEYLGSRLTMAKSLGNDMWMICKVTTNDLPATTVAVYAYEFMNTVSLTNAQVYVDFGSFVFGNEYDQVIARNDCALVLGVAKVSQGTYDCTQTISVTQNNKEYQLMKGSSSKYDYYTYDGYLIQVAAGLDVTQYITFK